MPLKLIERVLPWLVGALSEDEARNFLKNLQLAGIAELFVARAVDMEQLCFFPELCN